MTKRANKSSLLDQWFPIEAKQRGERNRLIRRICREFDVDAMDTGFHGPRWREAEAAYASAKQAAGL